MLGQESLINKLKSYNILTFPQTLMLVGEKGCGKHLLVKEVISPHLQLEVVDITGSISSDNLSEIYVRAVPAIYLINASSLSIKEQNTILKFIEEPISNSFIILLAENRGALLDTVLNRCSIYSFEPYTSDQLMSFIDYKNKDNKNLAVKILKTPGQALSTPENKLERLYGMCKMMALRLQDASVPNALEISSGINYGDDESKFDINMFFECFALALAEEYTSNNKITHFNLYNKTTEYIKRLSNPRLNKQYLVENFLLNAWSIAKNQHGN
jgi:DNA polymerase-3 subunit delta'